MKLVSVNHTEGTGVLSVINNAGRLCQLQFPLDSLFKWYPCCNRYDYKYSNNQQKLYIIPVEPKSDMPIRYHVHSTKSRASSKVACTAVPAWHNKEVAKENELLFNFAKKYDIITPDQEYTLEHVQDSITKVLDIFDMLYSFERHNVRDRHLELAEKERLTPKQETELAELTKLVTADREDQATYVLSQLKKDNARLYARFGEVYTMLQVMRKVVK